MSTETQLPNGDVIVFKDPADLPERARRQIKKATMQLDPKTIENLRVAAQKGVDPTPDMFTREDLLIADDLNDASAVALIESWTRGDQRIDPNSEALQDLPGKSYDALITAAGPIIKQLAVEANEPDPDPSSPTPPADA